MCLILLNLLSKQQIKLNGNGPIIIGRKNIEECYDKRVSRAHVKITCTDDGRIRVKALHCNPCFFARNGVLPVALLKKDEEEVLEKGDYLGLLPNTFWFEVTTEKEMRVTKEKNASKPTISSGSITTAASAKNESRKKSAVKIYGLCSSSKATLDAQPLPTSSTESCSSSIQNSDIIKTRKLPLWMYEIVETVDSQHSVSSTKGSSKKKQKISDDVEVKVDTSNIPSTSKAEIIDKSLKPKTEARAGEYGSKNSTQKRRRCQSYVNDNGGDVSRPLCQYGRKCYRKNPQHKSEFCHPGDSDYISYDQRPMCPFGAVCYRKNVIHKLKFRHPRPGSSFAKSSRTSLNSRGSTGEERPSCLKGNRCWNGNSKHRKELCHPPKGYVCQFSCARRTSSPLPAKRKRKKVKSYNSDYADEDEYDLEDPFINDASSDEYVPSDLDLEDEEED